ncbi:MAG TPA: M48 family metalloprotease [Caulobacteraceae bacterium]|jgi:predicted Zn-dependent protease
MLLSFRLPALALGAIILASCASAALAQDEPISIVRDTEIEAILHQEADPIFVAAGLDPKKVEIHIIGDKELNAFSTSGLNIYVNTGLILKTDTPDQLEGVIAHETGHVAGGHVARSGAATKAALGPMLASIGLGVLAAAAGSPEGAAALVFSSTYFGELGVLGYSREQESRADEAAATYLEKAGYSGRGLVSFFDHYRYQEVFDDERKFPYFRDHPLSDDRIEALRVRVEKEPHASAMDSPEAIAAHNLMKAKIEAFMMGPYQTLIDYPESDTSFAARYARAIALYKENETDQAVKAIDALIAEQPNDPYLWELKGQVLFEAGRAKDAVPAHRKSVELKPDAPLLRINLGQALLALNDPKQVDAAIDQVKQALSVEPDNALGWQLIAEAYDSKGLGGMARLATAEQNFYLGQQRDARVFALRARILLKKDSPEWRRATDIILSSNPTPDDLKTMAQQG